MSQCNGFGSLGAVSAADGNDGFGLDTCDCRVERNLVWAVFKKIWFCSGLRRRPGSAAIAAAIATILAIIGAAKHLKIKPDLAIVAASLF